MQFSDDVNIDWYRSPIDKSTLAHLMVRSDLRGALQTLLHLGLFFTTLGITYLAFQTVDASNWPWALPLLTLCLFVHGTIGPFIGLVAIHELQHRTVFKTRVLNELFEVVYAFISWSDYIWYEQSHARHHRATCHHEHDGEIYLPQRFSPRRWQFWLAMLAWNPLTTVAKLRQVWRHANGTIDGVWANYVLPADDLKLRAKHKRWARILLIGHGLLAIMFITSGHWFLIVLFTFGTQYCAWLGFLTGLPQHMGMNPNEPDFRQSTRTFTCSRLVGFYYWNMQYHLEHHMYPAVPFHQLPNLRETIKDDLPVATHGLRATWKEIMSIRSKAIKDPTYRFSPEMTRQQN